MAIAKGLGRSTWESSEACKTAGQPHTSNDLPYDAATVDKFLATIPADAAPAQLEEVAGRILKAITGANDWHKLAGRETLAEVYERIAAMAVAS